MADIEAAPAVARPPVPLVELRFTDLGYEVPIVVKSRSQPDSVLRAIANTFIGPPRAIVGGIAGAVAAKRAARAEAAAAAKEATAAKEAAAAKDAAAAAGGDAEATAAAAADAEAETVAQEASAAGLGEGGSAADGADGGHRPRKQILTVLKGITGVIRPGTLTLCVVVRRRRCALRGAAGRHELRRCCWCACDSSLPPSRRPSLSLCSLRAACWRRPATARART